jgi:signal transduction histidine kinase
MLKTKEIVQNRHLWIVVIMLAICAFYHYYLPQLPFQPLESYPLTRQAIVRIIFLLPVAAAAFAFGRTGGLVTLAAALLIMLPRVFLISDQPIDAFFETIGVAVVGTVIVWIIDTQEKERKLRQKAVEELETVNAIARTLTRPYDLDAMLDEVLNRVLEVVGSSEPKGAIFLLDPWGQTLHLRAHRGLSSLFIEQADEIPLGECLCGLTAEAGEVLVVRDALSHPQHTRCPVSEPHVHVCVPLKSMDRLLGVIDFCLDTEHPIDAIDQQMFAAIGRQIGVAVDNARLCENLRFYIRQVTDAQEDERRRIARELHDETAQGLIGVARRLDDLATSDPGVPELAVERLEQLYQQIEDLLQGVRRFSRDLRPSVLDDLGLLPAVEGLMIGLEESGIECELDISGEQRRLSPDAELALFRIVQEALNNIKRHANATEVVAAVEFDQAKLIVAVCDNGDGFEMPARVGDLALLGRFGFVGMHERAQLLRGTLIVQAEPGRGTTVMVEVPM